MHNLDNAINFVKTRGNEIGQARLKYLLAGERPSTEIIDQLFTGQRVDGGWAPFWASDYSSLDATCFRLAQAEQLGVVSKENVLVQAVQFLARRQSLDGSWEEDRSIMAFAPPWAKPGDLSAQLYLTANCGFWLALLGDRKDQKDGASKAAGYLLTYLEQYGHLPSFLHTHWLAGGLCYKLDWKEPAELIFTYLGSRINDLAASNLAWLLTTMISAGVSPSQDLIAQAADLLEHCQKDNGRWPSEDGPDYDVHSTLEALRALYLCGRGTDQQAR